MKYIIVFLMLIFFQQAQSTEADSIRTIHVYVALCDNIYQGIVRVPDFLGNGQDPKNNLYWGATYGIKTFLKNSGDWILVKTQSNQKANVLERIIFKHKSGKVFLLADAYDGSKIKETVTDFLKASSGDNVEEIDIAGKKYGFGGKAELLVYNGHNGLMDCDIDAGIIKKHNSGKKVVILACRSADYFGDFLRKAGAFPLIWTTGLMAPEAYILKAIADGWILNESNKKIHDRAANAYNNYQKCGLNAANYLFKTGW